MSSLLLLSVASFALQVLLSPTLANQFAGRSLIIILTPPYLVMALAFSAGLWWRKRPAFFLQTGRLLALSSLSTFLALGALRWLLERMTYQESEVLGRLNLTGHESYIWPLILLLCLPFGCYALVLSSLVAQGAHRLTALLSVEMLGAALGIVLQGLLLDTFSWRGAVLFVFACLWLAHGLAAGQGAKEKWGLSLGLLLLLLLSPWLEPQTDLRWGARWSLSPQGRDAKLVELEKSWNTYSKVQKLEIENRFGTRRVISLGDGNGTAQLSHRAGQAPLTVEFVRPLQPRQATVLFCGAGAELLAMREQLPGMERVVGVELNPQLVEMALTDETFPLRQALQDGRVELVTADARAFLQRDRRPIDLILYSWSGATMAFYAGAAAHTARFAFTREALASAWRRLNPDGYLVFFGVSKVNLLATLREALPDSVSLTHSLVLLEKKNEPRWKGGWDFHVLYVKKGEVSAAEVAALEDVAQRRGYRRVVSPGLSDPQYQDFVSLGDPQQMATALERIGQRHRHHFQPISDARPFPYDVGTSGEGKDSLLVYSAVAGLLALLLVAWVSREGLSRRELWRNRLVFGLLGAGGVLLQLYAIYLMLLFLGNPTWSLIYGMGGSLLAIHLAMSWVQKHPPSFSRLTFMLALGVLSWVGLALLKARAQESLFALAPWAMVLALGSLSVLATTLLSTLYPFWLQRLESQGEDTSRWFVVDAVVAAFTCGIAPLVVELWGLNVVLVSALLSLALAWALSVAKFHRG